MNPTKYIPLSNPMPTGRRLMKLKELKRFKTDFGRGLRQCIWDSHIAALKDFSKDKTITVQRCDEQIADEAHLTHQISEFQKLLLENTAFLERVRNEHLRALAELVEHRKALQRAKMEEATILSRGTSMHPLQIPDSLVETKRMAKLIRNTLNEKHT